MAGTKDRRAITHQRISAWRVEIERLRRLNETLRGIRLSQFSYQDEAIGLGMLKGNRFAIVLR